MELIEIILTPQEREILLRELGRDPSAGELAMVAAMWSEHCSYKHSKYFLKQLPQRADHLLAGPGENAGVIKISDTLALAFKIESHNHPSAVVPYQGAATGVGGILRDIFTMGARPIALLNSLHFDLSESRGQYLFSRVVEGIGDYGNCMGIPTIGGEVESYRWFGDNPLMNALCLGKIHPRELTKASTARPGDLVLYFGNKTGKDGLEGAIFASLNLSETTREQKSAVQVGDPFMGKLIMEATLELNSLGLPSAMQDMGAAGLTCSCSEIAHSSGLGIEVHLDRLPLRVRGMKGEEILLSESQERMLATIPPEKKERVEEILNKYPLDYGWIGELNDSGKINIHYQGEVIADMDLDLLLEGCPIYEYGHLTPEMLRPPVFSEAELGTLPSLEDLLKTYLETPAFAGKQYIYEQFDHEVTLAALSGPGKGHSLLYDPETQTVISVSLQSRSPWMRENSYQGGLATLALAFRNSIAQGAYPLGLSNCLNFPSPEKESQILAFGQTVWAMKDFCEKLEIPVTGGNVSFYNETEGSVIPPTPVFVLVGKSSFTPELSQGPTVPGKLYLTGYPELKKGEVFFSHQLREKGDGSLEIPAIHLTEEKDLGEKILDLYLRHSPHLWIREIGSGGLFKRLVENFNPGLDMALREGSSRTWQDTLFGEGPLCYLIFLPNSSAELVESAVETLAGFPLEWVGEVKEGSGVLHLSNKKEIDLGPFKRAYDRSLGQFFS